MVDIVYLFHNRLEYNKIVFPQLIKEIKANEKIINNVFIYDDISVDGSADFIKDMLDKNEIKHTLKTNNYHSSVKQLQDAVDNSQSKYIMKIDSDILIPDDYIKIMYKIIEKYDYIGFLAAKETGDLPYIADKLKLEKTRNIGGVGIFRKSLFNKKLKPFDRYYGFTKFQWESSGKKFWVNGMTNTVLDKSIAFSRVEEYTDLGWSRNVDGAKNYVKK
jgi:glycosyltransferase involved in cell wall biosynthesis